MRLGRHQFGFPSVEAQRNHHGVERALWNRNPYNLHSEEYRLWGAAGDTIPVRRFTFQQVVANLDN